MFRIEIIDRGKDCAEVKIKESIHIRNLKPSHNIMEKLLATDTLDCTAHNHTYKRFSFLSLLPFLPSSCLPFFLPSSVPPSSLIPPSVPPFHISSLPLTYGYRVPLPFIRTSIHIHTYRYICLSSSLPCYLSFLSSPPSLCLSPSSLPSLLPPSLPPFLPSFPLSLSLEGYRVPVFVLPLALTQD